MFSTKAYEQEAFRVLVREANRVAEELKLPEKLPITESNVTDKFISPFGYSYMRRRIGRIATAQYSYAVVQGNKFSDLTVADTTGHATALGELACCLLRVWIRKHLICWQLSGWQPFLSM